ncbi:MAG: hypothetical protein H6984_00405 [Pseudomonadales bacterium]|nr:hypothetical protein [Halioglobus sp.]MCP5120893.1 hypothetical protein [Pseudomonadales bacterium]MCP5194335.1 hypothetical protein [Pseudomonadales bacterium]
MRLPALILLIAGVTGAAAAAPGAEVSRQYLALCKMDLSQRYGEGTQIKLVSMRRSGQAVLLKVAVRVQSGAADMERVEFTTCRVERELPPAREEKTCADNPGPAIGQAATPME